MSIKLLIASEKVGTRFAWNMKTTNQFFLLILVVWVLAVSKETVFFSLRPIYGGGDGSFLKYMSVIPLN